MESRKPKEGSKNPDVLEKQKELGKVFLNEIPLIGGKMVRRVADFDSKKGSKASMMNKK